MKFVDAAKMIQSNIAQVSEIRNIVESARGEPLVVQRIYVMWYVLWKSAGLYGYGGRRMFTYLRLGNRVAVFEHYNQSLPGFCKILRGSVMAVSFCEIA